MSVFHRNQQVVGGENKTVDGYNYPPHPIKEGDGDDDDGGYDYAPAA